MKNQKDFGQMKIEIEPIGYVRTDAEDVPRHWTISDVEGTLVVNEKFLKGLKDIEVGQQIVVLFNFHKSRKFSDDLLIQHPPHKDRPMGVFSICSPKRPNPIGLSVVEVLAVTGSEIHVKGIDMLDGTPILDIKPNVTK